MSDSSHFAAMILLGALCVALLFLLVFGLDGQLLSSIKVHFDLSALVFVLIITTCFVCFYGFQKFLAGLRAILFRPKESQPEIANCYRKLAISTLRCGIIASFFLTSLIFVPTVHLVNPVWHPQLLTTAILIVLYSGWLALLLFMPISFRYSVGNSDPVYRSRLIVSAMLGLVALLGIFAGAPVAVQIPIGNVLQQFAGRSLYPWLWMNLPSFVLVTATIGACRLGMGKLHNQRDWIPICIFIGILWTLHAMVLILSDVDPETFATALWMASITTLYGCLFALAAFLRMRIRWIVVSIAILIGILVTAAMIFSRMFSGPCC